jgi:hypothetical protein
MKDAPWRKAKMDGAPVKLFFDRSNHAAAEVAFYPGRTAVGLG